ncbi:MAG TPA: hypothetical protein V6C97_19925, partial [Oculatellaceae cyanobacterium]
MIMPVPATSTSGDSDLGSISSSALIPAATSSVPVPPLSSSSMATITVPATIHASVVSMDMTSSETTGTFTFPLPRLAADAARCMLFFMPRRTGLDVCPL